MIYVYMSYKQKYLKYKQKYIGLRDNLVEGEYKTSTSHKYNIIIDNSRSNIHKTARNISNKQIARISTNEPNDITIGVQKLSKYSEEQITDDELDSYYDVSKIFFASNSNLIDMKKDEKTGLVNAIFRMNDGSIYDVEHFGLFVVLDKNLLRWFWKIRGMDGIYKKYYNKITKTLGDELYKDDIQTDIKDKQHADFMYFMISVITIVVGGKGYFEIQTDDDKGTLHVYNIITNYKKRSS